MSALKSQQSASKAGQSSRDVNSGDRDVRQPHESQGSLPVGSMPRDSTLNPPGKIYESRLALQLIVIVSWN